MTTALRINTGSARAPRLGSPQRADGGVGPRSATALPRQGVKLGILLALFLLYGFTALADELATARAALLDGLYQVAQNRAEHALAAGNNANGEAFLLLLEALAGQGRHTDILKRLDAAAEAEHKSTPPGALRYWRALALLHSGRPRESAAVAADGDNGAYGETLRRLEARALVAGGEPRQALPLFDSIDRQVTNLAVRAENALEWALALEGIGEHEQALAILKVQAELDTAAAAKYDGALLRGRILLHQGKGTEAATILNQLAMAGQATEAARVQALVEMSVHAFQNSATNEAIAYARTAWQRATAPQTRRLAGYRLGDLLCSDSATIDEGEEIVKALVREFPGEQESRQAQLRLADALLQRARPERAATEYRIYLETYPASEQDAGALQGHAWALMRLGRYAEASTTFLHAAQLATNDSTKAECLLRQGDALLAEELFAEAAAVYSGMAEKYPRDLLAPRAMLQSAAALARAGKSEAAAQRYRDVARQYAELEEAPQALLGLARLLEAGADTDGAVNAYDILLENYARPPYSAAALLGRGRIHYRCYRFEAAMQDFATVAENAPEDRDEARFMMVLCLYGLGRDQEARAGATAYLMEFPTSARLADMVLWLGKFDFNKGRYEEARRFFLDYAERWPESRWADAAVLWAARAAFRLNDFTGTIELVSRLVRAYPKSARLAEALLIQSDALMELARFDEAVLLLDKALASESADETRRTALMRKADAFFAMGAGNSLRYREALAIYRQLLEQADLTPSLALQLNFKVGRALEKLGQLAEAVDIYYTDVVTRYLDERARGTWFDEFGTTLFVRAAFAIAEIQEQQGLAAQAINVLRRVEHSGVPGADEARRRIERLRGGKVGIK